MVEPESKIAEFFKGYGDELNAAFDPSRIKRKQLFVTPTPWSSQSSDSSFAFFESRLTSSFIAVSDSI